MVCLPSNPVNQIYNILTLTVPHTKPLAGESSPTCVWHLCHGSTGKAPGLQPQCSHPGALPFSSCSHIPWEPLRDGSRLSSSCSSLCVLGPVLGAGRVFAVFIFQKGAKGNQPVPWKKGRGCLCSQPAVTQAGRMERRTMTLLCCLSPDQKQTGTNLTPPWDRHKCQDTEMARAVYSGNVRASQPCWIHKGLLLPPQHKPNPAEGL